MPWRPPLPGLNPRPPGAGAIKPLFEEEAAKRKRAGKKLDHVANLPHGNGEPRKARDKADETVNVSPRSVEAASIILKNGVPDLAKLVEQGTVSVLAASTVAHLPRPEQKKLVSEGPKAILLQLPLASSFIRLGRGVPLRWASGELRCRQSRRP